jgi:inosose dehydratase
MSDIQLACHTDPWGPEGFVKALTEITAAGYSGIETSPELVVAYEDRVPVMQEIFHEARASLSAISATVAPLSATNMEEEIERALNTARFLKATGSELLLLSPPDYPAGEPTPEEAKMAADWLNQVGKATQDLGVMSCFLPRMGAWPDSANDIAKFIGMTTAKYVKLAFDAWMMDADVAVSSFFAKHGTRVRYVILRDFKTSAKARKKKGPGGGPAGVALGKGNLPLVRLARTLFTKGYEGWVSLHLPPGCTDPRAEADAALRYTEEHLDLIV